MAHRLWAYVAAICKNHGMLAFAVGGMTDHIHVLFRLPPTITLVRAVTLIKSNSSKWIRKKDRKFAWQEGHGAFSVSSSGIDKVIQYIDEQEQRHRKFTFEQEYIALLKKHGIPFDPKNIFGYCRRYSTPIRVGLSLLLSLMLRYLPMRVKVSVSRRAYRSPPIVEQSIRHRPNPGPSASVPSCIHSSRITFRPEGY